jgi:hypothetical protein
MLVQIHLHQLTEFKSQVKLKVRLINIKVSNANFNISQTHIFIYII